MDSSLQKQSQQAWSISSSSANAAGLQQPQQVGGTPPPVAAAIPLNGAAPPNVVQAVVQPQFVMPIQHPNVQQQHHHHNLQQVTYLQPMQAGAIHQHHHHPQQQQQHHHHHRSGAQFQGGATGSLNPETHTEVYAADYSCVYSIPTADILSFPCGSKKEALREYKHLRLCSDFDAAKEFPTAPTPAATQVGAAAAAPTSSVAAAAPGASTSTSAVATESSTPRTTTPGKQQYCVQGASCSRVHARMDNATSHDIHVNFLYPRLVDCAYQRVSDGPCISVALPNGGRSVPPDEIPQSQLIATKALQARRRPVYEHCAHYYLNKMCNRGPNCSFVHAISATDTRVFGKPLPDRAALDDLQRKPPQDEMASTMLKRSRLQQQQQPPPQQQQHHHHQHQFVQMQHQQQQPFVVQHHHQQQAYLVPISAAAAAPPPNAPVATNMPYYAAAPFVPAQRVMPQQQQLHAQ